MPFENKLYPLLNAEVLDSTEASYSRFSATGYSLHQHADLQTISNSTSSKLNVPTLPGINELLTSRVLVPPRISSSYSNADTLSLPALRRDSVGSSNSDSPKRRWIGSPIPESMSDSDSDIMMSRVAVPTPNREPFRSPSSSAAAFGADGNFQPIRTSSIHGIRDETNSSAEVVRTASLYADPEFKPSGAGFTAEYQGVKVVPGFGTYHVYEGGFCIPTHIDGEAVNPIWGLTKSRNPRKRLPIACARCRRKKIRCEPSVSGCLQCQKAKRQCEIEPFRRKSTKDASIRECMVA